MLPGELRALQCDDVIVRRSVWRGHANLRGELVFCADDGRELTENEGKWPIWRVQCTPAEYLSPTSWREALTDEEMHLAALEDLARAPAVFTFCRMPSVTVRLARSGRETYSHMAMRRLSSLDRVFRALADGTRRSMIHALARGQARSAGELGRRFRSAQPTISRHLKVLERAGLLQRTVEGRVHRFRLRQRKLEEARGWIARHQAFWEGAVDRLDHLLSEPPGHARR